MPDTTLTQPQLAALRRAAFDERAKRQNRGLTYREKLESRFFILDKHQHIVPFILNGFQSILWNEIAVNGWLPAGLEVDVLKARQLGSSTFWLALLFLDTIGNKGTTTAIICKKPDETVEFRERVKRLYHYLPDDEKPQKQQDNIGWLTFPDLDSKIYIGTAGVQDVGRAMTIHNLLATEVAFWPHEIETTWSALSNAVPPWGRRIRESTANGIGNWWAQRWESNKKGGNWQVKDGIILGKAGRRHFVFAPWFIDDEAMLDDPLIDPLTDDEARLIELYGLSEKQIAWRRWKQKEDSRLFFQECAEDDISCFLGAGNCVFEIDLLREFLKQAQDRQPLFVGENGALTIWKFAEPEHLYVAGSDVASGDTGGDYSATGILDWETGEQVAVLHGHFPPEVFAVKSASLCSSYNEALWGVEDAGFGQVVLSIAYGQLKYPKLFWHQPLTGGAEKLGWNTNAKTRPILIEDLGWALRERLIGVYDPEFIRECLSFVRTERKPEGEAQAGTFDDLLFAWAIAWQMRKYVQRLGVVQIIRDRIPRPGA